MSLKTVSLHDMVVRHQAGDPHALDDLIRRTAERLERLASRMLRRFPSVRAREETGDVLQNALLRLDRALKQVTPGSVREYYGLASELLRRELIDLTRMHARRPAGPLEGVDPNDSCAERDRMEVWAQLQESIADLPVLQREVFCLIFYHGWTQPRIAELLQISDRQVRRLWVEGCSRLQKAVGGQLPD